MIKSFAPAIAVIGLMTSTAAFAQATAPAAPAAACAPAAAAAAGGDSPYAVAGLPTAPAASCAAPAAAGGGAATKWSSKSSIVAIMNNPAAKAAMAKTLPDLIPILEMYLDMIPAEATLDGLPDLSMGMVSAEQVKAVDADLIKL